MCIGIIDGPDRDEFRNYATNNHKALGPPTNATQPSSGDTKRRFAKPLRMSLIIKYEILSSAAQQLKTPFIFSFIKNISLSDDTANNKVTYFKPSRFLYLFVPGLQNSRNYCHYVWHNVEQITLEISRH